MTPISRRIEELTRTVRTMTGGNSANVKELMEDQFRFRRQRERVEDRLNAMLRTDLASRSQGNRFGIRSSKRSGRKSNGRSGSPARTTPVRSWTAS